jgi:hypothetical protein
MGWRESLALLQGSCQRTFSERFQYTAAGFSPVAVSGIFRDPHTYVDLRTTVQVSSTLPTVDVLRIDLPRDPLKGDVVTAVDDRGPSYVAGTMWRVVDAQHDGEGIWKLFLQQVSP